MNDAKRIPRLPVLVAWDGLAAMFGALTGGSTVVLFYNELGLDKAQIGLIGSMVHVFGPLAVFIGPLVTRFGFKRASMLAYASRKITITLLILAPGLAVHYSTSAVFPFVVLVLAAYGLFRVIAETALYPWMVEVVPGAVRGQYEALRGMAAMMCSVGAFSFASYVIGSSSGFWRFQVLFGMGGVIGLIAVAVLFFVPGGKPKAEQVSRKPNWAELKLAAGDRNMRAYVLGLGMTIFPTTAWSVFVPLYLLQEIGLPPADVILLQSATLAGSFLSSYIWGWAADRFGSRPVALSGLMLAVTLPVGWIAIPHNSSWSFTCAAVIALVNGVASVAWSIGLARLLYANIIPVDKKVAYLAVYYTAQEVTLLASPLLAGLMLTWLEATGTTVFGMTSYTFFFALTMGLCALGVVCVRRIQDDEAVGTRQLWARLPGLYPEIKEAVRKRVARRSQR